MRPILVAIVILTVACSARAQDDARFQPPQDWVVTKQPNGAAMIQPPGIPQGKTGAMVLPDSQGELSAVFDQVWNGMTTNAKVVSGGESTSGKSAAGFDTRSTTAVVDAPGGVGRGYIYLFAVQAGPRVRTVCYVSDGQADFDKYLPAVKKMTDSVGVDAARAAGRPASPAAPAAGKGPGLEGVYYRYKAGFDPAGGRGDVSQRIDFLCLAADGRAYNGHPTGGPVVCLEEEKPDSPSYGRYTLNGDQLAIQWNRDPILNIQHKEKLTLRPDGKLEQGGSTYHKLAGCDGLKLDGTYAYTWGDGSKTTIRFTKDGRFTARGLGSCVTLDDFVHPEWPKLPESGSGAYTIARNTLEVKYDNGPSRRIFFWTDPADPKSISVNINPLERQ